MTKTQCNKCMFSDKVSSDLSCKFEIPNKIKNIKNLSVVDDFYEIDNYRCLYGFSKNQYNNSLDNLKDLDIYDLIKNKADIKYYLIVDARTISNTELKNIIDQINSLEIKPRDCSIIINPNSPDEIYDYVKNNLVCRKWTIRVFVETLSFNNCINIILDTNLISSESWCLLFIDASQMNLNLNSVINEMQKTFIIEQRNFFGLKHKDKSLHMLCLNCRVYKTLVSTIDRDIIKAIESTPEIILETYEIK